MKTLLSRIGKTTLVAGLAAAAAFSSSCMTTYDAHGNPVQSVDPGLAIAGAAAAGLAGAAIASHGHHHHGHSYYSGGYYRRGYYARAPRYRGTYGGVSGGYYRGPRGYR